MREKPLVLIVDDEADIRDVVKIKLQSSGFDVIEADNGLDGVRMAREKQPDLMLLDVVMPKMDGAAALIKLKSDPDTKDIKVLLFTGKGDPRPEIVSVNKKFAIESGAVDFIRKEIDLDELVSFLNRSIKEIKEEEEIKENRKKLLE